MKLTIITPTLLRDSLLDTCFSIDAQDYVFWEHILMVDVVPDVRGIELLQTVEHPNRVIVLANMSGESGGYPGSKLRHMAGRLAQGDYLLYIDDDDVYVPGALEKIAEGLRKRPAWAMFPIMRFGERFYNPDNLAWSNVSGIQIAHKKGYLWPSEIKVSDDWHFIEFLEAVHGAPARIDGPELARITQTRGGV